MDKQKETIPELESQGLLTWKNVSELTWEENQDKTWKEIYGEN